MPNLIPDWEPWMRPAGRLVWSIALFVIGVVIVLGLMKRPKPDRPSTWSECMAGAVGVFAMMALGYAVIPHEWITFSDKYLQWDTTKFLFRSHQDIFGLGIVNWPFNFDMHNIRDIIVVRDLRHRAGAPARRCSPCGRSAARRRRPSADEAPKTSRFGRPLRRKSAQPVAATAGGDA